jgi:archaellum biogenesis ATPase FlaH|tara:strand:+ start:266 stop:547 length:282 start_codon:yes stop_codon:yes gene_type:complete
MNEFLEIAEKVGFPIAGALTAGFFIFIILKFILNELTGSIKGLNNLINGLVNRIDTMNNDIVRIDALVSVAFNRKPNLERLAAADGKEDSRKD